MVITNEEAQNVKEQLIAQLDNVPESSRESIRKQIEAMSNDDLEAFLKKNQALDAQEQEQCVFCSIAHGKAPAMKIDENNEAVAVLDINPISKGHTLIIPKVHDKEPTEQSQELAFSVGKRIVEKLQPKDITTRAMKVGEHTILNVVPIYEGTDFEKRTKPTKEEFEEVAQKISVFKHETKKPELKDTSKGEVEQPKTAPKKPACIFCAIAQKETNAYTIDENKDALAILEVNPVSKGHALIIPRAHVDTINMPASTFTLAKKIAKKVTTAYKPNDVTINQTSIKNHAVIEVIPIYEGTNITKREKKGETELLQIQADLHAKKRATTPKTKTATKKETARESVSTEKKKQRTFILPKRPKYPELPQYGSRIP